MGNKIILTGVFMLFAWIQTVYAANLRFDVNILDSAFDVGGYTSIAIDSNNKIHISYYDASNRDSKYATNASGSWVYAIVDSTGNVGGDSSIAIDSNNKVHISYYYATNGDLKYATNASGSLVYTTLYSIGNVGLYTSIAIDSNNKVYISYYDATNYDLKYATNVSGSWVITTLDSTNNVGLYTSIAIDSNNKVNISYYGGTNLDYATNASGSWVYTILDSTNNIGQYTSIAIDSNNKVYISYYDGANGDLKYATNVSGSWVTLDSIGYVGGYSSIAIDSNNKVYISYYDATNGDLKYTSPLLNNPSVLSWTGEPNYISDGIDYDVAYKNAVFTFKMKYADVDGDTPVSGYPKLHIKKGDAEISGSPFPMTEISGNYSTGIIYTASIILSNTGKDYSYYVEGKDKWNDSFTGAPASWTSGPIVLDEAFNTGSDDKLIIYANDGTNTSLEISADILKSLKTNVAVTIIKDTSITDGIGYKFEMKNNTTGKNIDDFNQPITLTINYTVSDGKITNTNVSEADAGSKLGLYYYDSVSGWKQISSTVDTTNKTISGKIKHLSTFAVKEKTENSGKVNIYPNPLTPNGDGVNDYAEFYFDNPSNEEVSVKIYNKEWKYIKTIAGTNPRWDGKDDSGNTVETGVYICQLKIGNTTLSGTLILAK